MFEKYIVINESNIIVGQTSNGVWYCKELPAKNTQELNLLINDVNSILNNYNSKEVKQNKKKEAQVLGLGNIKKFYGRKQCSGCGKPFMVNDFKVTRDFVHYYCAECNDKCRAQIV